MKVTIDHRPIDVPPGTTVMQAAASLGIRIPAMCLHEGVPHRPSCMVCMVKEVASGKMFPSCTMPAVEGMVIDTLSEEVRTMRREALELLLSDHTGDCEAPCRIACPAFMDIPGMNRLIAAGDFSKALERIREEIALPLILGYICPAPCEKVCHRRKVDEAVSICLLKRFTAGDDMRRRAGLPGIRENGKKVAVVGSGPAGLSAAYYLRKAGTGVTVYEEMALAGGALRHSIPEERLPRAALDAEIGCLVSMGIRFLTGEKVDRNRLEEEIIPLHDAVILATGDTGEHALHTFYLPAIPGPADPGYKTCATGRPGIFWCGHLTRHQPMAVRSAARGKEAATETLRFLQIEEDPAARIRFRSVISHLTAEEAGEYLQESRPGHREEPADGQLTGFSPGEAVAEAARCLHCDCRKPATCKLRLLAEEYGADRRHFAGPARKKLTRIVRHEMIVYEPEKCIKCGTCIEISAGYKEELGMTFIGRGFDLRVGVPLDGGLHEGLTRAAVRCAEACPTGALARRNKEELP